MTKTTPWPFEAAEAARRDPRGLETVQDLARRLGYESAALENEAVRHHHRTAARLLERWRLDAAADRLESLDLAGVKVGGDEAVTERLAADLEWPGGGRALESSFRSRWRLSPARYLSLRSATVWRLELPGWWRRDAAVAYGSRDPSSRHEAADSRRLRWALNGPRGPLGLELRLPESAAERVAEARLLAGAEEPSVAPWAHRTLIRLLGLHLDPEPFERRVAEGPHSRLIEGREGLTVPQTAAFFDGVTWVVCGQQVSLVVAFKMRNAIADHLGRPLAGGKSGAGGMLAPPTAEDVASTGPEELYRLGFSRRKEQYLQGVARQICSGEIDARGLGHRSALDIERQLLAIRGFGPWSVNYLMMRALGLEDCVPVGDVALARALEGYFALDHRPGSDETRELMTAFAPHRSLATFHLWASLQDGSG
ncbi:MAG: hypothetical protein AAF725_24500 [Acidobacteriota bacterium]